MATSKQARKRIRQNEKRRLANKATQSAMRTAMKKLRALVDGGQRGQAQQELPQVLARIDKAAKKHVIHKNAAARKKGQMMRAVLARSETASQ
jgi:small subunit ribosomal protein S20